MSTFDKISDLSLTIDNYSLKSLVYKVEGDLGDRKTTVFELHGLGKTGVGENVTYFEDLQKSLSDKGPILPLAGDYTFGEFSNHLSKLDYFPDAPKNMFGEAFINYRRWAIESAALDLVLQQNGLSLADALGLELKPLAFVASMRLGDPSSFGPIEKRLARYPKMRFKLDPTNDWTDELIEKIAATNTVDIMDFKGFYKGTDVEVKPDPQLYQKIVDNFPDAWLEDPDVTKRTRPVLQPHADRITWDFPIHDLVSLDSQPWSMKCVNIKPSRFGAIKELFAVYDYCRDKGIKMYSGGQTEIGPGRGQVQYLSALFHADSPNDIAPAVYNSANAVELPTSPLILKPKSSGFQLLA